MKKQLRYKDEIKPLAKLIILPLLLIMSLVLLYFSLFVQEEKNIFQSLAFIFFSIGDLYLSVKEYKKYKSAIANRNSFYKYEKKFKGHIIKTQISTHTKLARGGRYGCRQEIVVYEYYAVVEFINDNGDKVTFTTLELNGNPEYLATKEVTVYSFDSVYYATDFGYIEKTKEKFMDDFIDSIYKNLLYK